MDYRSRQRRPQFNGATLGIKIVASEFVAYTQLAELKDSASSIQLAYNKSVIMATYMLCGLPTLRQLEFKSVV